MRQGGAEGVPHLYVLSTASAVLSRSHSRRLSSMGWYSSLAAVVIRLITCSMSAVMPVPPPRSVIMPSTLATASKQSINVDTWFFSKTYRKWVWCGSNVKTPGSEREKGGNRRSWTVKGRILPDRAAHLLWVALFLGSFLQVLQSDPELAVTGFDVRVSEAARWLEGFARHGR